MFTLHIGQLTVQTFKTVHVTVIYIALKLGVVWIRVIVDFYPQVASRSFGQDNI